MKNPPATRKDTSTTQLLVSSPRENAFSTQHLAKAPSEDVEEIFNSFHTEAGKSRLVSGSNMIAYDSDRPNSKR